MNELTLATIASPLAPRAASAGATTTQTAQTVDRAPATFSDYVRDSLAEVNRRKIEADQAIEDLATGRRQDIHGTMIAAKKAEISFELLVEIRNKLMSAYDEIRRMPI